MKLNVLGVVIAVSVFTSLAAHARTKETTKKIETTGDGCTTNTVRHNDIVGSRTVRTTNSD